MRHWVIVIGLLVSCGTPVNAPTPSATSIVARTPTPTPTSVAARTPTPDPATLRPCASATLQAVIAWERIPGDSLVGAVFVANRGAVPCTLRGNPELGLRGDGARTIDVRTAMVTGAGGAPAPVVVPVTQFREDPAGLAGIGARAPLEWENYCATEKVLAFTVILPEGAGRVDGTFVEPTGVPMRESLLPRCEDGAGTSTLAIYPLQEPVR